MLAFCLGVLETSQACSRLRQNNDYPVCWGRRWPKIWSPLLFFFLFNDFFSFSQRLLGSGTPVTENMESPSLFLMSIPSSARFFFSIFFAFTELVLLDVIFVAFFSLFCWHMYRNKKILTYPDKDLCLWFYLYK